MKPKNLQKLLQSFPKSYYSLAEIKNLYTGKSGNLPVILNRMVKDGILYKIIRGYYTLNEAAVDWEELACNLKKPSYISLESALYHHGFIDQLPAAITLVTIRKPRTYFARQKTIEYSHVNPKLFFGYEMHENTLIASKEKALLDELYLISLKKNRLELNPGWFKQIDKKIFSKMLKMYPEFTRKIAMKYI